MARFETSADEKGVERGTNLMSFGTSSFSGQFLRVFEQR